MTAIVQLTGLGIETPDFGGEAVEREALRPNGGGVDTDGGGGVCRDGPSGGR